MKKNKEYTVSSGNVFADLALLNAQERLAKAELAYQINELIIQKGLAQAEAAQLFAIDQPKISALKTGKIAGFSLERLFRFLNVLDQEVTIKITPKKSSKTKPGVTVAISKLKNIRLPKQPQSTPQVKSIQARKKSKA